MKQYLNEKEAAEYLGVNARTVMRWTRSGKLATVDFPAASGTKPIRRYALADLEKFVKKYRTPSVKERVQMLSLPGVDQGLQDTTRPSL